MNCEKKCIIDYSYPSIVKKEKRSSIKKTRKFKKRKYRYKYEKRNKKFRCENESDSDSSEDEEYDPEYDNDSRPRNWFWGSGEIFLKGNHIWFNTSVSKSTTNRLVRMIHNKNIEFRDNVQEMSEVADLQPKPLYLHINSYGGDLLACMAVIDAIKLSKVPVHTIVEGVAASAGTLMSVVGHHRSMTQNSYMLIHQLSTGMHGKMEELEEEMVNNKVFMNRIKDLYENHTSMKRSEITSALKHDLWWDAETCLKKGLIDEIVLPSQYNDEDEDDE